MREFLYLLLTLGFLLSAQAEPALRDLPSPLKDWVGWVKSRHPEWSCAYNGSKTTCTWPGAVTFDISQNGATFNAIVELLAKGDIPLPISDQLRPHSLKVVAADSEKVFEPALLESADGLLLRLPAGRYQISGAFTWSELPEEIPLPAEYGILSVNNRLSDQLSRVIRTNSGFRFTKNESSQEEENLSMTVFRRVVDGSPLTITTRLELRVSGRSRSISLGGIIPVRSLPVAVESQLPYQLKSDGVLALQLVPGQHTVSVDSILAQPIESIELPVTEYERWPLEETVIWQPDPAFRSVKIEGLSALSTELAQIPTEWVGGASYVAKRGASFQLRESTRGEQSQQADSVNLDRFLWLDLDGGGFTVRDTFSGSLFSNSRLNALPTTGVTRATINGQATLVAVDPSKGSTGVELRTSSLNLETVSRLTGGSQISAGGWDHLIERVAITLALPPSWKLIDVQGAASVSGSALSSWTLLDLFLVILISMGIRQLFGTPVAIVAGLSLVLNHGEYLAPQMLLVHLVLLVIWRSFTKESSSSARLVCNGLVLVTFITWTLQVMAFVKLQVTQLLYPQLQAGTRYRTIIQEVLSGFEGSFLAWPFLLLLIAVMILGIRSISQVRTVFGGIFRLALLGVVLCLLLVMFGGVLLTGTGVLVGPGEERKVKHDYAVSSAPIRDSYVFAGRGVNGQESESLLSNQSFSYEKKVLLSGAALPEWSWKTHRIELDGQVAPERALRIILLSPFFSGLLSLARASLILVLACVLFRRLGFSFGVLQPLLVRVAVVLILLLSVQKADCQVPSDQLLSELEARMKPALCNREQCSEILEARLKIDRKRFTLSLVVSSEGVSSLAIPGPLAVLAVQSVSIAGTQVQALRRTEDDYLEVKLDSGLTNLQIEGAVSDSSAFSVELPITPIYMKVDTDTWLVEGVSSGGVVSKSIRFTDRAAGRAVQVDSTARISLPNWISVSRRIAVSDHISVTTTISRIGDLSQALATSVPLLSGEQVTTSGFRVENGSLNAVLPAQTSQIVFESNILYRESLNLLASNQSRMSETWELECAPIVNCQFSGLRQTSSYSGDAQLTRWRPFPGEKIEVKIVPLNGITGDLVTIDGVEHSIGWGAGQFAGELVIRVRATQQETLNIRLPADADLKSALVDQQPAGLSNAENGEFSLLLNPGDHSIDIRYSLPAEIAFRQSVPQIVISQLAHNVRITVKPSRDRWILWTGGLAWGPAVVFWSKLLCVVALTVMLSLMELLPCSRVSAVFLGVGLTTLPLAAIALPLLWLVCIQVLPRFGFAGLPLPKWSIVAGFSIISLIALALFYKIVQIGLVLEPPMLIAGNQSTADALRWFIDHSTGALPQPWVLSLPLWCWRVFALVWSTWLALSFIGWFKKSVSFVTQG